MSMSVEQLQRIGDVDVVEAVAAALAGVDHDEVTDENRAAYRSRAQAAVTAVQQAVQVEPEADGDTDGDADAEA